MITRCAALVLMGVLTLTACGDNTKTNSSSSGSGVKPTQAWATKLESAYVDANGARKITDSCDAAMTNWQCFYDGVEPVTAGTLRVKLSTDAGTSGKSIAGRAGRAWFTMIGADHKDLTTVVVAVNGVDTATVRRGDVLG